MLKQLLTPPKDQDSTEMKHGSWAKWVFCPEGGRKLWSLGKGGHSPGKLQWSHYSWHFVDTGVLFHPKQSSSMWQGTVEKWQCVISKVRKDMWFPLGFLSWIIPLREASHHNRILGQPNRDTHVARNWSLLSTANGGVTEQTGLA